MGRKKQEVETRSKTRGVSVPEDLYQAVQEKLNTLERGWDFSKYVQRLVQYDLVHHVIKPDPLLAAPRQETYNSTVFKPKNTMRKKSVRGGE